MRYAASALRADADTLMPPLLMMRCHARYTARYALRHAMFIRAMACFLRRSSSLR